ncbi:MAG: hypothetical protein WA989_18055 [Henriciella sp.]|uniref:hypothetical protein n=1 Tax=Henriciella sp. TaxID=1968823 RepID=UPI003C728DC2
MDVRNPPAAHNAVRFIGTTLDATARSVYRFKKGSPRISYQTAYNAIHDHVHWGLDEGTLIKMVQRLKSEQNRKCNHEFLQAYFDYHSALGLEGVPAFDDQVVAFRVSAGLKLPVKPTAIVAGEDRFNVLTCLGWSTTNLSDFQKRLWMTIHEDALFSLTDFRTARGVFSMYPKIKGERELVMWERGDYDLLSMGELDDNLDMLAEAIRMAEQWIADGH